MIDFSQMSIYDLGQLNQIYCWTPGGKFVMFSEQPKVLNKTIINTWKWEVKGFGYKLWKWKWINNVIIWIVFSQYKIKFFHSAKVQ